MSRLPILLLALGCSQETTSMPHVTYSQAAALAQLHDIALIFGSPSEDPVAAQRRRFTLRFGQANKCASN